MPTSDKSKAKGISASSFLDLRAELAKKQEEFTKSRSAGKPTYTTGGVPRPENKKLSKWVKENKGVRGRAARDIELEEISRPNIESAMAALKKKAKIYDKLSKGKTGGLDEKQYDALLVDFESKPISSTYESDSDDVDESLQVPRPPDDEDDPVIEYEDEFGRLRTARRSNVPRGLMPAQQEEPDEDEDIIIRDPTNYFPVYEPSAEKIAEVRNQFSEEYNPLNVHYDASRENRARGAGFYDFSQDEESRRAEMERLKNARLETQKNRQETGAVDLQPGEVEGMRSGEGGAASVRSRALDERKRKIEERRKLVDAKRKKPRLTTEEQSHATEPSSSTLPKPMEVILRDPIAVSVPLRPKKDKPRSKEEPRIITDADMFLAQLEQDLKHHQPK